MPNTDRHGHTQTYIDTHRNTHIDTDRHTGTHRHT